VDDDAFSSAVLLLQVTHNKNVSRFSISLLEALQPVCCSLFTSFK